MYALRHNSWNFGEILSTRWPKLSKLLIDRRHEIETEALQVMSTLLLHHFNSVFWFIVCNSKQTWSKHYVLFAFNSTLGNKWQDKNCGFAAPFICKRPEGTVQPIPTPSSVPAGGGCPDDWYFHSGRCYYVGGTEAADRYDWQTAKSRCVNALTEAGEIGNLATIHSHEEQGEARFIIVFASFNRVLVQMTCKFT